jgi:hypothetical protein
MAADLSAASVFVVSKTEGAIIGIRLPVVLQ